MTTKQPYREEFKIEAVKQITEQGHPLADVSAWTGVSQHHEQQRSVRRCDVGEVIQIPARPGPAFICWLVGRPPHWQ